MAISIAGLENLWQAAGGSAATAPQAAAIAEAESSGNPNAVNSTDPSGGSFGLWQINNVHASALVAAGLPNWQTDPLQNAEAAVLVWKGYQGGSFFSASGGPWYAEAPGQAGNATYQAALAKEASGNIGTVPQLGTGSRPGAGLAGAVSQPSTTPGQTVAQQTVAQGVTSPITSGIATLQTSWSTFWTAHPAWVILAGLVLLIVAWALIGAPNPMPSADVKVNP